MSKPPLSLQKYDSPISLPISSPINKEFLPNMQHCNRLHQNRSNHRRRVLGSISLAEDIRSNDPANSASANDQSTRDGALRLPDNVVVHVAKERRDVGVAAADAEEDARVSCGWVGADEACHGDADDGCAGVEK